MIFLEVLLRRIKFHLIDKVMAVLVTKFVSVCRKERKEIVTDSKGTHAMFLFK